MREEYSKEQLIKSPELTIRATRTGTGEKLILKGNYVVVHYSGETKKSILMVTAALQ